MAGDMNEHVAHILIARVNALETQMKNLQDTLEPKVEKLKVVCLQHRLALEKLGKSTKGLVAKVTKLEEDLANLCIVMPSLPPLDDEKMPPWEGCEKVNEEQVEPMS